MTEIITFRLVFIIEKLFLVHQMVIVSDNGYLIATFQRYFELFLLVFIVFFKLLNFFYDIPIFI